MELMGDEVNHSAPADASDATQLELLTVEERNKGRLCCNTKSTGLTRDPRTVGAPEQQIQAGPSAGRASQK